MVVVNSFFILICVVNCFCYGLVNKVLVVINKFMLFGRLIVKKMWVVIIIGFFFYSLCLLVCRSIIVMLIIVVI